MTRLKKWKRGRIRRPRLAPLTFRHVASKPVTVYVDSADTARVIEEYAMFGWDLVD